MHDYSSVDVGNLAALGAEAAHNRCRVDGHGWDQAKSHLFRQRPTGSGDHASPHVWRCDEKDLGGFRAKTRPSGFHVLVPDYRGYGESGGTPRAQEDSTAEKMDNYVTLHCGKETHMLRTTMIRSNRSSILRSSHESIARQS